MTSPAPGAPTVTLMVAAPERAVTGFTTMLAGAPGPALVLQVTATVAVAVSRFAACIVPAQIVSPSSAPKARKPWFFNTDESIRTILFLEVFSTTSGEAAGIPVATWLIGPFDGLL